MGLLSYRMFFGIDLADESYYLALIHRFVHGDRPFIDEIYWLQTASFSLIPLYKVVHFFNGGTSGIVLFTRFTYLIGMTLLTGLAYLSLRQNVEDKSLLGLLVLLAFIPYNTPGLGYNTLGVGYLLGGLFLGYFAVHERFSSVCLFACGFFLALSEISYISLLPAQLAVVFLILFLKKEKRFWSVLLVAGGALLACLLIALYVRPVFSEVVRSFQFTLDSVKIFKDTNQYSRLAFIITSLFKALPGLWYLVSISLIYILIRKKSKFVGTGFSILFVLGVVHFTRPILKGTGSHGIILNLGLFLPLLYLLCVKEKRPRDVLLLSIPSFVALLVMSYSSDNGIHTGVVPLVLPAAFSLILLERLSHHPLLGKGLVAMLLSIVLYYQLVSVPEGRAKEATEVMESGPFKYLRTRPERKEYCDELATVIAKHEDPRGRLFMNPQLPAGYLYAEMAPLSVSSWGVFTEKPRPYFEEYLNSHRSPHNLYISVKGLPRTPDVKINPRNFNFIENWLESRAQVVERTRYFDIWKETASAK